MDLSTIKRKLDAGQYNNPWEVCMGLNDQLVFVAECTWDKGQVPT